MTDSVWHELAIDTAPSLHVEQIVGGAAVTCDREGCLRDAVLLVITEPDLDPGPSCAFHAWEWLDLWTFALRKLYPPDEWTMSA